MLGSYKMESPVQNSFYRRSLTPSPLHRTLSPHGSASCDTLDSSMRSKSPSRRSWFDDATANSLERSRNKGQSQISDKPLNRQQQTLPRGLKLNYSASPSRSSPGRKSVSPTPSSLSSRSFRGCLSPVSVCESINLALNNSLPLNESYQSVKSPLDATSSSGVSSAASSTHDEKSFMFSNKSFAPIPVHRRSNSGGQSGLRKMNLNSYEASKDYLSQPQNKSKSPLKTSIDDEYEIKLTKDLVDSMSELKDIAEIARIIDDVDDEEWLLMFIGELEVHLNDLIKIDANRSNMSSDEEVNPKDDEFLKLEEIKEKETLLEVSRDLVRYLKDRSTYILRQESTTTKLLSVNSDDDDEKTIRRLKKLAAEKPKDVFSMNKWQRKLSCLAGTLDRYLQRLVSQTGDDVTPDLNTDKNSFPRQHPGNEESDFKQKASLRTPKAANSNQQDHLPDYGEVKSTASKFTSLSASPDKQPMSRKSKKLSHDQYQTTNDLPKRDSPKTKFPSSTSSNGDNQRTGMESMNKNTPPSLAENSFNDSVQKIFPSHNNVTNTNLNSKDKDTSQDQLPAVKDGLKNQQFSDNVYSKYATIRLGVENPLQIDGILNNHYVSNASVNSSSKPSDENATDEDNSDKKSPKKSPAAGYTEAYTIYGYSKFPRKDCSLSNESFDDDAMTTERSVGRWKSNSSSSDKSAEDRDQSGHLNASNHVSHYNHRPSRSVSSESSSSPGNDSKMSDVYKSKLKVNSHGNSKNKSSIDVSDQTYEMQVPNARNNLSTSYSHTETNSDSFTTNYPVRGTKENNRDPTWRNKSNKSPIEVSDQRYEKQEQGARNNSPSSYNHSATNSGNFTTNYPARGPKENDRDPTWRNKSNKSRIEVSDQTPQKQVSNARLKSPTSDNHSAINSGSFTTNYPVRGPKENNRDPMWRNKSNKSPIDVSDQRYEKQEQGARNNSPSSYNHSATNSGNFTTNYPVRGSKENNRDPTWRNKSNKSPIDVSDQRYEKQEQGARNNSPSSYNHSATNSGNFTTNYPVRGPKENNRDPTWRNKSNKSPIDVSDQRYEKQEQGARNYSPRSYNHSAAKQFSDLSNKYPAMQSKVSDRDLTSVPNPRPLPRSTSASKFKSTEQGAVRLQKETLKKYSSQNSDEWKRKSSTEGVSTQCDIISSERIKKADDELAKLRKSSELLRRGITEAREERDDKDRRIAILESRIQRLKKTMTDRKTEKSSVEEEIDRLQRILQQERREHSRELAELRERCRELETEIQSQNRRISDMEEWVERLKMENEKSKKKCKELENEKSQLEEKLHDATMSLMREKRHSRRLQTENTRLEMEITELKEKREKSDKLKEEKEREDAVAHVLEETVNWILQEEALTTLLGTRDGEVDEANQRINELVDENELLSAENDELRKKVDNEQGIAAAATDCFRQQIEYLSNEVSLQQESARAQKDQYETEINRLLSSRSTDVSMSSVEVEEPNDVELDVEVTSLRSQIVYSETLTKTLYIENERLRKERDELKEQLSSISSEKPSTSDFCCQMDDMSYTRMRAHDFYTQEAVRNALKLRDRGRELQSETRQSSKSAQSLETDVRKKTISTVFQHKVSFKDYDRNDSQ